jgi:hypothetical protein
MIWPFDHFVVAHAFEEKGVFFYEAHTYIDIEMIDNNGKVRSSKLTPKRHVLQ